MLGKLPDIPEEAAKVEKLLRWFFDFAKGGWIRRFSYLLLLVVVFGHPELVAKVLTFFLVYKLPHWYAVWWIGLLAALLVAAIVAGAIEAKRSTEQRRRDTRIPAPSVRGFLPFNDTKEDAALFTRLERGRELDILMNALCDPGYRFGILTGPSGTGKTSFLRAGLLARLRTENRPVFYVELSNEDPLLALDRELKRQGRRKLTGVLVLDQFEQFFIHQRTAAQRRPFLEHLKQWYQPDSHVQVLVSLRAEDVWQMKEIQEELEYQLSNQNYFRLRKFTSAQAVEVLRVLCEDAAMLFDQNFARGIVDRQLRDSEDGLISPVNLAIAVFVLATSQKAFTPEGFQASGGMDGLLEAWLYSHLEMLSSQDRDAAIRILSTLCDFDFNRRAGSFMSNEIVTRVAGDLSSQQVESTLRWLSDRAVRLIVRTEESGVVKYQLAHERLIPAIRKAAGKLLDDAARANILFDRRVGEWVGNNRSSRFLLTLFEYRFLKRQLPYVIWGPSRQDKEDLLTRTRRRWQRRVALVFLMTIMLIAGRVAWTTDTVQRPYIAWKLSRLATFYGGVVTAQALAVLGDIDIARNIVHREYIQDKEDEDGALSDVAVSVARAALFKHDPALLQEAWKLVASLRVTSREIATAQIAVAMAEVGNFDEALECARTSDNVCANALWAIAVEMAKAGQFAQAQQLANTLDEDRIEVLALIAEAMTDRVLLRNDNALLGEAQKLTKRLDPENRMRVLKLITVRKAELGRITNNQVLLDEAQEQAKQLDWIGDSIELWKIAVSAKNHVTAKYLLTKAYDDLAVLRTGEMKVPCEILELGYIIKDKGLQEFARQEVDEKIDDSLSTETLCGLADQAVKFRDTGKAMELLEEAWQKIGKTENRMDSLIKVVERMAQLHYLKRAREVAEYAGHPEDVTNVLARIILIDEGIITPSPASW